MTLFKRPVQFWNEVFQIEGSATPFVLKRTLIFGFIALLITIVEKSPRFPNIAIPMTPYEIGGVVLGALLVLRTNAGYERWWEARKLWGGIVNTSRNLAIGALAHGPADPDWRRDIIGWTIAFAHISRRSLRGERTLPELVPLIGQAQAGRLQASEHMPNAVSLALARLLREGAEAGMDRFAFLQAEEERAQLIDHLGACERILKTPLPTVYSIQIHQFIVVFLITLPFGILDQLGWLTPLATMLAAYPVLVMDEIGMELQNPFSRQRLNHLPLDEICHTIESNLVALLNDQQSHTTRAIARHNTQLVGRDPAGSQEREPD